MLFMLAADKSFGQDATDISFEKLKETCKDIPPEERLRIIVTRFSVSSRAAQATGQFGEELTAIMVNALQQTNCFRVLESTKNKSDLDGELSNNDAVTDGNGPQGGQQLRAQAIVTAEITEYSNGTSSVMLSGVSTGANKAKIGIVVKVIDPQSRELLWSKSVNAEAKKGGFTGASILGFRFTGASKVSEAMSAAVEDMVLRTVDILVKEREVILKEFAAKAAAPKISKTTIVVNNTNFMNITGLSNELKDNIKVTEISGKTINGTNGSFVVLHQGSTDSLAEIIYNGFNAKFEIVGMEPGVITLDAKKSWRWEYGLPNPEADFSIYLDPPALVDTLRYYIQMEAKNLCNSTDSLIDRIEADYANALTTYHEFLDSTKNRLAPEYSRSLSNLAGLYMEMGAYDKALRLYLESLEIVDKTLGKSHPDYGRCLNNLAGLYESTGQYDKALRFYLESLGNAEKTFGKSHPEYDAHLNNLAGLYHSMGEYDRALPLYLEAKENAEKTLGKSHPDYGRRLNNLGMLYNDMGSYQKAVEAFELAAKYIGESNPDYMRQYAGSLNNLAATYRAMGNYEGALSLYRQTLENIEKILGKSHPSYGIALNNIAALYAEMGDYDRALPLLIISLENTEKALGKSHPDYGECLSNLAGLYSRMGDFSKSAPLYLEALEIIEKTLGKFHPSYAARLRNLADLYQSTGGYSKSLDLYTEVEKILKKVLGTSHPDYAFTLLSLSKLYQIQGDTSKALDMALESLKILEIALGKSHPEHARCAEQVAGLYEAQGDFSRAIPLLTGLLEYEKQKKAAPSITITLRLAQAYMATRQYAMADSLYADVLNTAVPNGDEYIQAYLDKGVRSRQEGDFVQAAQYFDSALVAVDKRISTAPALCLRVYSEYAALHKVQNNRAKADSLYTHAQSLGPEAEHLPEYATMLLAAASLKREMGQMEQAERLLQKYNELAAPKKREEERDGKNLALFFCTDQYKDSTVWSPLKNAISDGEALAAILYDKYGFDTLVYRNLELDTLMYKIETTFHHNYQDNDQLFLFFAGHGYFNETTKTGGVVAHNTKKGKPTSYFSYEQLGGYFSDKHPCKHIFLVIDVCFSGTFFKSVAMRGDTLPPLRGGMPIYKDDYIIETIPAVREAARYPSRHALSSSGKETVSDGDRYSPRADASKWDEEILKGSIFLTKRKDGRQ
jgi:curli biogenesis system outer membrane secretion channel CsgG/lipopolysaccharide biosynthesis regulator YciM